MAAADSIIVLDDDDEDEPAAQPGPSHPPSDPVSPGPEASGPSESHGDGRNSHSGGRKCYKLENERLFEEFLELCKMQTSDHPEVVPFLHKLQQRAQSLFLASAEFCNILSRVLSRARNRPAKLYVYINELCTVLKAHSNKKKLNLAPVSSTPSEPSGENPPADPSSDLTNAETTAPEASRTRGSRRQIQRLEQLLALYVAEIRRLQEKELDLSELDDPDSTYLQEARLKRKLIRLFGRLCELKDCCSLTGRVIEQRIPYRGTRYPEVNRRIERLINKPGPDTFPDYGDVLRAVERAATRHSLGLPRQQLQLMAQDAFRDVGVRLQERRHLDLIYNFGCHLTDDYRPGIDPALSDPTLARRLRENRTLAMSRLDEVISKYAMMQDKSEEGERQKRRARLLGTNPSGSPKASLDSGEGPSGMASQECPTTSKAESDDDDDDEEEESEEEEEEEEDEEEVTEDEDEDLEQLQEDQGGDEEEEEEEGGDDEGDKSPKSPSHTPTRRNSEPVKGSPGEQQDRGLTGTPASPLAGLPDAPSTAVESSGGQLQGPLLGDESPRSQLSELEMEAVPEGTTPSPEERDISSSRKQSEDALPTILENGADVVTSTSFNGRVSCHTWRDSSPPYKRSRKEKQLGSGPLENSYTEKLAAQQGNGKKMSVATQCDPEEIIVLSDSD
ncbi:death domain-associated protein 6 isoform X2 [Peromyscus maniculatus bairdii]|uniref:death domain-associated protein 6 isoform X2 n=1 Tax=Peromyscus maniculatus bairdii TaxID=230844 RepID=UPI001C2EED46|nr:death domain-associated protein 6 isoform X2 [Peromyscus maniculatus bairdii]